MIKDKVKLIKITKLKSDDKNYSADFEVSLGSAPLRGAVWACSFFIRVRVRDSLFFCVGSLSTTHRLTPCNPQSHLMHRRNTPTEPHRATHRGIKKVTQGRGHKVNEE